MRRELQFVFILIFVLPVLSSCTGMTVTPSVLGQQEMLLATPVLLALPFEACDQATLAAA